MTPATQTSDDADVTRTVIQIRITPAEKQAWEAAAVATGMSLSEWVRRRVNGTVTIEVSAPVLVPPSRARQQRNKASAKQFAAELKKGGGK